MQTLKDFLNYKKIPEVCAVWVYLEEETIPKYEELNRSGRLYSVVLNTEDENGNQKTFKLLHLRHTSKIYIRMESFNACWRYAIKDIEDVEFRIKLNCMEKRGRRIVLENNQITFKTGLASNLGEKELPKRQRILRDENVKYIYSKANYTVHDKSCKKVETIPTEFLLGSKTMPEEHIICEECSRRLYLREMMEQYDYKIYFYLQWFDSADVSNEVLKNLSMKHHAKIELKQECVLRVKCNQDAWEIVILDDGRLDRLLHNSYMLSSNGTRFMTGQFHEQKGEFKDVNAALEYIINYSFHIHMADQPKIGSLVSRNERISIFKVYRSVEMEHYVKQGLTHELLDCGYERRKQAQIALLTAAGFDMKQDKYADNLGTQALSEDLVDAMRIFSKHVLGKNDYGNVFSRRILVQLGIQEEVKPLITSDIKKLSAYLCRDTERGRVGLLPRINEWIFDEIRGREDFTVLALEDVHYLMKIGKHDVLMREFERDAAIKQGIKIITAKGYCPIEESAFVAAFITGNKIKIPYTKLFEYMKGDKEKRMKMDASVE